MTDTMLAAVWERADEPLRLEEIRLPPPRRGEALIRVSSCGVCHTDLHVMRGEVSFPAPAALGHEISGEVVELGPDVPADGVKVGQQITPLVRRGIAIVGSFGARTRVDLPAVVARAAEGALSLADTVTRRYPLEQVNEAFTDLRAGRIRGRAVVHMGGDNE